MDRITDLAVMNVSTPNLIRDNFVNVYLPKAGAALTQNKLVAMFRAAFNIACTGVTSAKIIDGAFFPESEHFMVLGIRALNGASAAINSTDWVASITDAIAKNGRFSIDNGGSTEIKDMPLTVFQTGANDPDQGVFLLPKPIFWKGQNQLSCMITFPTVVATANYNIRFELIGIKLI